MKKLIIAISINIFFGSSLLAQEKNELLIGGNFNFHSTILDEERTCLISLPDSYYDTEQKKKYPIIILLDGYSHFKSTTGIVHFMSSERNRNHLMAETIIVAIENVDRERDFTVTKIKTKRPNTMGGGRNFLKFIEQELIPFVDNNYRTVPNRTLVGHSLGGLLTLNAYMDQNSLFNGYISIDPSIWWDEEMMKNKVNAISSETLNKKLYIATANQGEANYSRNKKRHDALFALIKERTNSPLNVELAYFEEENHRSVPLIAVYKGLKYLNRKQ